MKIPPVLTTALDINLSNEERERFAEEHHKTWFSQTLDRLFIAALGDKELKQAFLDNAKSLAKKRVAGSQSAMILVLLDYAQAAGVFGIDDTDRIYERLIEHHMDMYGKRIESTSMQNRVSKASAMALDGKLPELPEWVLETIEARKEKHKHSEGEESEPLEYLKGWGY